MSIFKLFKKSKEERKPDYLLNQIETINNLCMQIASIDNQVKDVKYIKDFTCETLGISPSKFINMDLQDDQFQYTVNIDIKSATAYTLIKIRKFPLSATINRYIKEHLSFSIKYDKDLNVRISPKLDSEILSAQTIFQNLSIIESYLRQSKDFIKSSKESHNREIEKLQAGIYLTK